MEQAEPVFKELKGLVDKALPDLRCLRCGTSKFLLDIERPLRMQMLDPIDELPATAKSGLAHCTLTCARRGFVERHNIRVLANQHSAESV